MCARRVPVQMILGHINARNRDGYMKIITTITTFLFLLTINSLIWFIGTQFYFAENQIFIFNLMTKYIRQLIMALLDRLSTTFVRYYISVELLRIFEQQMIRKRRWNHFRSVFDHF